MPQDQVFSHPSGLVPRIVQKVAARRGQLHAFNAIDPVKTALVVVDMTGACVKEDMACREMVPRVNAIAHALRTAGGCVAWVTPAPDGNGIHLAAIVGEERAAMFGRHARADNPDSRLWSELAPAEGDLQVQKKGFSAFFPGKCDLPGLLEQRGIDCVLIAGTVTNVCCESSARDAVELGYKVIMVSDLLAGHSFGLHEASLNTFFRIFGDVRPSGEILDLIAAGR